MEFNSCFETLQSKYFVGNSPAFVALLKRDFTTMYNKQISTVNLKYYGTRYVATSNDII